MDVIKEIEDILCHEIGHLLIDLQLIEKHPEISIKEILIRNFGCENYSWCGWVDLEPKSKLEYKEVVKNSSLTAFKFLSLVSGCVFQTQYGTDNIDFNDCFTYKKTSIGKGDHDKFWELPYQLRNFYKVTDDDKKAFYKKLNNIIFEKYITEISKLDEFQNELEKLISRESKMIFTDYVNKKKPKNYSFKFEGDYLDDISKELIKLMIDNGLKDIVQTLYIELIDTLDKHIFKK